MSRRVHFHRDYDHRWPSRAITAFKAGWTGTVKAEVVEAALAKDAATLAPVRDKQAAHGRISNIGRSGHVARPHDAADVGAIVQHPVVDGASE